MKRLMVLLLMLCMASLACTIGIPAQTKGSGNIIQKTYDVQSFNQVQLDTIGEVHIEQGKAEALTIETDDNTLPLLDVRVKDGVLILREEGNGHNFKPSVNIIYTITVKDLSAVTTNASGDIFVDSLNADNFSASSNASGDIAIAGTSNTVTVSIDGSGDVSAGKLHVTQGDVNVQGSGNATVWTDDELRITLDGSGNVSYYGRPNLKQSLNGSGQINNLGKK